MIQGRTSHIAFTLALIFTSLSVHAAQHEAMPGEYVIKVKNNRLTTQQNFAQQMGAISIRTVAKDLRLHLVKRSLVEDSDYALKQLQANPNVEYAEPNYIYRINRIPNDPQIAELWGLHNEAQKGGRMGMDIGAVPAWDIQTGSDKVIVAVIDTGLDYTHPDLVANSWSNEAELNGLAGVDDDNNGFVDDIHGYDFVNKDGDPMDDHGHGTHVSGTIGAKGNDGEGIVGVNWDVKIMGVKFLSAEGSGTLADAVEAINYATKMGAVIQSNSWGGGGFSQSLLDAIVAAEQQKVLFVAAAGNSGTNNDESPTYPSSYEVANVVSVAAINNKGELADFSCFGAKTVHIAAPGVDIYSSLPKSVDAKGYDAWSGTSMATPHVSGIAALLKAQDMTRGYAEIKEALMAGAVKVSSLRNKVVSRGIANAYYSLSGTQAPPDANDPFNWVKTGRTYQSESPYKPNSSLEFEIKVEGATEIAMFFEIFETENYFDYVEFFDANNVSIGKWSGNHSGEFSPVATGDTIRAVFKSDDSVQGAGFQVTQAAYR